MHIPHNMKRENLEKMDREKLIERVLKLQKAIETKVHCINNQIDVLDQYRWEIKDLEEQLEIARL